MPNYTNYTDYKFYYEKYKGNMSVSDFDKMVTKASCEVRKRIFNRDITKYEYEIQMATCSVADILQNMELIKDRIRQLTSSNKNDRIVSSASVADVSKTYANTNSIVELENELSNQNRKIKQEIELYLYDTGLLYRGV